MPARAKRRPGWRGARSRRDRRGRAAPSAQARQRLGQPLHALARGAIDDAALALVAAHEVHHLARRLGLAREGEVEVRPVERAHEDARAALEEPGDDLVAGAGIGAGGDRDDRRVAERVGGGAQLHVFRAEVVAPLRDAMGLVDRQAVDAGGAQPVERPALQQALGRDVEQPHGPRRQRRLHRGVLGRRVAGVQRAGGDAARLELAHLVAHQGDQRRDDDGEPAADHGRQLVAERLARARRHDGEHVGAGEQRLHHLGLAGPQRGEAEHPLQRVERLAHGIGGVGRRWRAGSSGQHPGRRGLRRTRAIAPGSSSMCAMTRSAPAASSAAAWPAAAWLAPA